MTSFAKIYSAIPSDTACYAANPDLWELFSNVYKSDTDRRPTGFWSEAEVIQYLDLRTESDLVTHYDDLAKQAEYYNQFG